MQLVLYILFTLRIMCRREMFDKIPIKVAFGQYTIVYPCNKQMPSEYSQKRLVYIK